MYVCIIYVTNRQIIRGEERNNSKLLFYKQHILYWSNTLRLFQSLKELLAFKPSNKFLINCWMQLSNEQRTSTQVHIFYFNGRMFDSIRTSKIICVLIRKKIFRYFDLKLSRCIWYVCIMTSRMACSRACHIRCGHEQSIS